MAAAHGVLNIFYSIFLSDHGYSKSVVGGLWSIAVLAEIVVFFFIEPIDHHAKSNLKNHLK